MIIAIRIFTDIASVFLRIPHRGSAGIFWLLFRRNIYLAFRRVFPSITLLRMQLIEFILYVSDQDRSMTFYRQVLARDPVLHMPGMTEFELSPGCKLGLMPENGIARIIADAAGHPDRGNGIPRCEVYLLSDNLQPYYNRSIAAGAKLVNDTQDRDWGHKVCYFADPDGHILAFAQPLQA